MPQERGIVVADPQVSRTQFSPGSVKQNIEISTDSDPPLAFHVSASPRVRGARVHLGASQRIDAI